MGLTKKLLYLDLFLKKNNNKKLNGFWVSGRIWISMDNIFK